VAFGNHWGFIDDLAGFDGSVYVQVLTSTDAQVWRSSDLGTWEQAFGWSWPLMSLEAPRFSRPAVVGGRLFIGLSDSDQGPSPDACRIWSTGDGLNWELSLEEDPPCRLHALFEYQGLVYAVIDSPMRLVRSQDGSNWTTVAFFPADAYWVYTTQSFGGAMYLGGRSLDPGGDRLWRFNGTELSAVGQTLESCDFVFATTAFRNELYLGCYGATGEVWSTPDGESWQLVVDDGFSAGNVRVAGLAAHQVRLFAWSDDWPAGGNLWSTDNLVDWDGSLLSEVIRGDGLTDLRVVGPRLLASSGGSLWQLRPLFADGFETGDLSAWSQSVP
jgi:hypothetical protein